MNVKIYCIYYKDSQIDEYNLKETDIVKLFNTNANLELDNINYLSKYFCELTTYYYVLKNQIKYDYIGFCHYSRNFHKLYLDYIDNNHTQTFYFTGECKYSTRILKEYIKDVYGITNYYFDMTYKHMYIFTWETFNKVCEFIFGFYEWLKINYHINWKDENDMNNLIKILYEGEEYWYCYLNEWPSCIATFNEFAIAYYISQISEVKTFEENIKHILIYNSNNKENLYNVYKKI